MLKLVSSVVLSVVLSVSVMLGLVHNMPKAQTDWTELRQAARTVEGLTAGPFGEMLTASCSAVSIQPRVHLTAAHCDFAQMTVDGVPAVVLKKNDKADLMLVYADTDAAFVPFKLTDSSVGKEVTTVGFPFGAFVGYVEAVTSGVVQGFVKGNKEYGTDRFDGFVMMSLPIIGGNSGGGIFTKVNGKWYVYTIVSMGAAHLAISPSNAMVRDFLI